MDVINTIMFLTHRSRLFRIGFPTSPDHSPLASFSSSLAELLKARLPLSQFGLDFRPQSLNALLTFMRAQALREAPSLPHAVFSRYHVDTVTLRMSPPLLHLGAAGATARFRGQSWRELALIVETTMHGLSNIIEHLHQSFYYYILPDSDRYVSIGGYVIPFALVSSAFLLDLLSLVVSFTETNPSDKGTLRNFAVCLLAYAFGIAFARDCVPLFSSMTYAALGDQATTLLLFSLGLNEELVGRFEDLIADPQVFVSLVASAAGLLFSLGISRIVHKRWDGLHHQELKLFGYIPFALFLVASALLNYSLALYWSAVVTAALIMIPFLLQRRLWLIQLIWVLLLGSPFSVVSMFGAFPLMYQLYLPLWILSIISALV